MEALDGGVQVQLMYESKIWNLPKKTYLKVESKSHREMIQPKNIMIPEAINPQ